MRKRIVLLEFTPEELVVFERLADELGMGRKRMLEAVIRQYFLADLPAPGRDTVGQGTAS